MVDEPQISLEKFNTGAGYYIRINELLKDEASSILNGDKTRRYNILCCLYLDLFPKCNKEEMKIMETGFTNIVKELNKYNGDAREIADSLLTEWSIYMRNLLEEKGMLTPKGKDPRKAMVSGF